jgi:protoporphyrinogen oxidase
VHDAGVSSRVVVVGAGLSGLSCSLHLGSEWDVVVLESEREVGGVARSRTVGGFTFDYTGHLLHLRDAHVKELVDRLLPGRFRTCTRRAAVHVHGTEVPYPFQANLHGLPPEVVAECLVGFVEALLSPARPEEATTFHDWAHRCFGSGIARHFMIPYNAKLYARDLHEVTADWVSWSVPRPSLEQVIRGALGIRNEGMGYNPTFLYPAEGGIDCLPRALAEAARGVTLAARVERVDLDRRVVALADGTEHAWDRLVSTMPLPDLVRRSTPLPDWAREAAAGLTAVGVVGYNFGVGRPALSPHDWVYVPDPGIPFYRVGFPTSFAPASCPPGCSSIYAEVSFPSAHPPDVRALELQVLEGLHAMGVLRPDDAILVRDHVVVDPAYVIFDAHRARVRDRLLDLLLERGVQSIGRYGAWTYSSMEDAILAGKQAADVIMGRASAREHRAGDR